MIAPAGGNNQEGPRRIYNPMRFYRGAQQPYGPNYWPAMTLPNPFPFLEPSWFPSVDTHLRFHPLLQSAHSTKPESVTGTPSRIQELRPHLQLTVLRVSDKMAPKLSEYGRGVVRPNAPSTFDDERRGWAGCIEQAHAIHGLWLWYQSHCWPTRNDVVNGEPSVQDQVFKQVINAMNLYAQARYRNLQPVVPQLLPPDQQEPRGYYPIWRRAVHVDHSRRATDKKKAGFPDFVLTTDQKRTQASSIALMEVKTFWSYDWNSCVTGIYSIDVAEQLTGDFIWRVSSKSHKLLKQVWGEMLFF